MSLQFREVIAAPSADLIADTRLLEQPSNAARLDVLQGLLRKRGLTFTLQPFPNNRMSKHNLDAVAQSMRPKWKKAGFRDPPSWRSPSIARR